MVRVHAQPSFGGQLFSSVAGMLVASIRGDRLEVPPCRIFRFRETGKNSWIAPEVNFNGDWPRNLLYNQPASRSFPRIHEDGCIVIRQGFRNADIFNAHRQRICAWLSEEILERPADLARNVFLLKSNPKADLPQRNADIGDLKRLPSFIAAPCVVPERAAALCREAKMDPSDTLLLLEPGATRFISDYQNHFHQVRPAGHFEKIHISRHAEKLAGFLTDVDWWATFLTSAVETHIFHRPRSGRR